MGTLRWSRRRGQRRLARTADGSLVMLPAKFDAFACIPVMFVMRTGGGGGWGEPYLRDPELVLRDVRVGVLPIERARDITASRHGDPLARRLRGN